MCVSPADHIITSLLSIIVIFTSLIQTLFVIIHLYLNASFCSFSLLAFFFFFFFFSSRRRHTRSLCDWSSDVCSSDLPEREHVDPRVDLRVAPSLLRSHVPWGADHRAGVRHPPRGVGLPRDAEVEDLDRKSVV